MSSANQLFLLADHIKLSLLERQRAQSLKLDGDSKDGHISRSLEQFRDGLASLEQEQKRLQEAGDEEYVEQIHPDNCMKATQRISLIGLQLFIPTIPALDGALTIDDNLPGLKKQFDDLTAQFHGFSSPSTTSTLTHPNDPSLAEDFAHATTTPRDAAAASSLSRPKGQRTSSKTVRFSDNDSSSRDPDLEAQLFGNRYRDDPSVDSAGYRDEVEGQSMSNQQIHAYHRDILDQQDAQLDALGESIARQRELSMQIGDELDEHVAMLDDVDAVVDRHQGRLDRARRQVGKITRTAGDNKQMVAIIILIIVLILLIALLK